MNFAKLKVVSYFLCLLGFVQSVYAYEVKTHVRLSQKAAACSILSNQEFVSSLGLKSLNDEDPVWYEPINVQDEKPAEWVVDWIKEYEDPNDPGYKSTIKTLIGWGAKFEDEEFKKRPLNHFFDPLDGRPIHPCPPFSDCNTSPDWSLEDGIPQPDLTGQRNSFFDANEHFFTALTASRESDRSLHWQTFFQTLGMVIHHVQDMKQLPHAGVAGDGRMEEHAETISWAMVIA